MNVDPEPNWGIFPDAHSFFDPYAEAMRAALLAHELASTLDEIEDLPTVEHPKGLE